MKKLSIGLSVAGALALSSVLVIGSISSEANASQSSKTAIATVPVTTTPNTPAVADVTSNLAPPADTAKKATAKKATAKKATAKKATAKKATAKKVKKSTSSGKAKKSTRGKKASVKKSAVKRGIRKI
jgi:cytoskeletal protein RodZ